MLPVAEARARILEAVKPVPYEWVALPAAHGRVLARDLRARRSQPPLPVSAMDGYAVRSEDLREPGAALRVIGEVPAGRVFEGRLGPGEAVRIFTGAPLPEGADAILVQERAERSDDIVRALVALPPGKFVRPAGLDFEAGWKGLAGGHLLDARALGLAAAMGHAWLPVRRRPRVAILATGDELVWPGETPGPAGIVSSNNPTLTAMVVGWGGAPLDLGIARDRPEDLMRALDQARDTDFVITSGGASVGAYDLVRETLAARGLEVAFWKIAMRPGKPLMFGRFGEIPFLGLPGNPVSAAVCAIVFLRAALLRSLGRPTDLPIGRARLAVSLDANDEREDYMRGRWKRSPEGELLVEPASRQDSSMFATFAHADLLIRRPPHDPARPAGEEVEIIEIARALAV